MAQEIDVRVLATNWLPLSRAALCLDCEMVYPLSAPACPRCGGSAKSALATWLKTAKDSARGRGEMP